MRLLSKAAILGAALKHEDIDVPDWGGTVRVRVMTGADRDEFRALSQEDGGAPIGKFLAALLALTLVDETGARLFTTDEIDQLGAMSADSLDAVGAVAIRINGMGPAAVEDAVKNSSSGQSDDSGSGSPSASAPPLENSSSG